MSENNNNFTEFNLDAVYDNAIPISQSPVPLDQLYAGFINCNGSKEPDNPKGCHIDFIKAKKNGTLIKSITECTSDCIGGVLADGVSVVDIDDRDSANIVLTLIQEAVKAGKPPKVLVKNTNKGIHVYHIDPHSATRKQTTNNISVLGVGYTYDEKTKQMVGRCDYKVGGKGYVCLSDEGVERKILYSPPNGELGELPVWLEIRPKRDFESVLDKLPFNHKSEGSRNDSLYRFYKNLLRLGYKVKDARGICGLINGCVFDEPLPDHELKSACRDEAPDKTDNKGGTDIEITCDTTADDVFESLSATEKKPKKWEKVVVYISAHHIFAFINDACYVYVEEKGIYQLLTLEVVDDLILHDFEGTIRLSDTELKNAKRQLYTNVRNSCPKRELAQGVVPFADGDYDLKTGEFLGFSPDRPVLSRLPHNKPTCTEAPQFVLDSLDDWADADEETKMLLVQIMAFVLTGQLDSIQQCVVLLGPARNGKTMFTRLLEHIAGSNNTAHLSMKDLSERFRSSELVGKRLNCCDELTPKYIEETDKFKSLIGAGAITVEKKGKDACAYKYDGVMVFASNDMPRLKDDTGAVLRRLCFCAFTHTFEKNDQFAKNMVKPENIEGYIYLALKVARVLYNEEKGFIEPAKSKPLIDEFKEANDPFGGFLTELDVESEIIGVPLSKVYDNYKFYAKDSGNGVMSKTTFGKQLRKALHLKVGQKWDKIEEKNNKVYVRE